MRSRDQRLDTDREHKTPAPHEPARPDAPPQEPTVQTIEPTAWPLGLRLSAASTMTCSVPRDLAVVLSAEAFAQLFGYAYATSLEISCLGVVRREGARFLIERFHLMKQQCSTGHTELDQDAIAAVVAPLAQEGKSEELTALKCWAHSHPHMGLFWSRTDDDTCARLVSDWLVSLVVSDDFAIRCRIDVGGPVRFTIDQVPVFIETPIDKDRVAQLSREVKDLVSEAFELARAGFAPAAATQTPVVVQHCAVCGQWHGKGECPSDDRPLWGLWGEEDPFDRGNAAQKDEEPAIFDPLLEP